ncbi:hypothetical protein ElyMa_002397800 [Elysia marginata]|uniref:Attacin C-terminal domain-containing protein n=1 Tax=Elysia marginata TaxID=1093978 RepID=A0AAV4GEK0_9GAST|nr:hypothetical protein ElyMa_002397800 [Elysia marginata]
MKLLLLIVAVLVAAAVVVAVPVPAKDALLLRSVSKRQSSISGDAKTGPGGVSGRLDFDHIDGDTKYNANIDHAYGNTNLGAGFLHDSDDAKFGGYFKKGRGNFKYGGNVGKKFNNGDTALDAYFDNTNGYKTYGLDLSHKTDNTKFGGQLKHGPGGTSVGGSFGGSWNDGRTNLDASFQKVFGGGFGAGLTFGHEFR